MKKVLVIGGSVIDIFAYPKDKLILGDSNPGYLKRSLGGVARNIAENLARLDVDTTLFTVLGKDEGRRWIMKSAQEAKLKLSATTVEQTPSYLSILNEENDHVVSMALMDEIETLSIEDVKKRHNIFLRSDLIVLDTNLSQETLIYIAKTYQNKEIYIDAISCQKADKIKAIYPYVHTLKMNLLEANHLAQANNKLSDQDLGKYFITQGVGEVYITKGAKGSFYVAKDSFKEMKNRTVNIKNTAGAGDAYLAGVIYAKVCDLDPLIYGTRAALITLQDEKAVSEEMCQEKIKVKIK
ncbi:MAG: carbohydrate kinase family protein [Acholeplasmataceae bacterium]|nr:carbohydrate kinase family protein [Acholeplasmataceae bacterium]